MMTWCSGGDMEEDTWVRYNVRKFEFLVFKYKRVNSVAPLLRNGVPLKLVSGFKYLVHIVN